MAAEGVWIKVDPDNRGYAQGFKCSNCGSVIALMAFYTECDYPYCPWCRAEMVETVEVEDDG